jgi:hypothetical protein
MKPPIILLVVLFLSFFPLLMSITPFDSTTADAYGHLLTMSDHLVVQASNDEYDYNLMNFDSLWSNSYVYSRAADDYIYSIGMGKGQNGSQLAFVAVGLSISANSQFVRILNGTNSCVILHEQRLPTDTDRREHFVMAVDDSGQAAFGLSMGSFFVYDLLNYTIQHINYSSIWNMTSWYLGSQATWYPGFIPFAMEVVSIDSALVVGYQCDLVNFVCTPCVYYLTWINVQNPFTMAYLLLLPNEMVYRDGLSRLYLFRIFQRNGHGHLHTGQWTSRFNRITTVLYGTQDRI